MGNCQTVDKYIVPAYNKISMHSHFDMEKPMKSISIRGVDDQLATLLKREAKAAQKSINQFVLEVLKKQVGLDKKKGSTRKYTLTLIPYSVVGQKMNLMRFRAKSILKGVSNKSFGNEQNPDGYQYLFPCA